MNQTQVHLHFRDHIHVAIGFISLQRLAEKPSRIVVFMLLKEPYTFCLILFCPLYAP